MQKYYAVLPLRCGNNSHFNRFVFRCGVNHCTADILETHAGMYLQLYIINTDMYAAQRVPLEMGRIYNKCRLRGLALAECCGQHIATYVHIYTYKNTHTAE